MLPSILNLQPAQLIALPYLEFDAALAAPGDPEVGRLELWEKPRPDHTYVAGADFAKGMVDRDFDACVVLDNSVDPMRQVFEAHGHWGPELFDRVLYCILRFYNAFLLGERQEGLTVMRRLLSEFGWAWMFYDRREESRGRRLTDKLGYWRPHGDVTLPNLRRDIRRDNLVVRSATTRDQLSRLQYKPKKSVEPEDATDKDLEIKLAGGGSPDLVMALAYANHAAAEVPNFPAPEAPAVIPGSNADILGHQELFFDPDTSKLPRHIRKAQQRQERRQRRDDW